jgi:hypothetical protein
VIETIEENIQEPDPFNTRFQDNKHQDKVSQVFERRQMQHRGPKTKNQGGYCVRCQVHPERNVAVQEKKEERNSHNAPKRSNIISSVGL